MALPEELFQQTLLDIILDWGLFFGAIFQLIAIAAIVVLPAKPEEEGEEIEGEAGSERKRKHGGGDSREDSISIAKGPNVSGSSKKTKKARKRK